MSICLTMLYAGVYLRNYCIDFNATCTKLIVIKFAVHLSWFCIRDARSTDIAHLALRYVTNRAFLLVGWTSTPNKLNN